MIFSGAPLNQKSLRVRLEGLDSDSVFPPDEAPSLNSRPTPIVPASEELRTLGMRSEPPGLAGREAREMMITQPDGLAHSHRPEAHSHRPEMVATEPPSPPGDGQRPSARPTASFGPARAAEQDFFEAAPGPSSYRSLAPAALRPRPRSRGRAIFARVLFVMIFAGIATLLGVAIKKKLELRKQDSPLSALVR